MRKTSPLKHSRGRSAAVQRAPLVSLVSHWNARTNNDSVYGYEIPSVVRLTPTGLSGCGCQGKRLQLGPVRVLARGDFNSNAVRVLVARRTQSESWHGSQIMRLRFRYHRATFGFEGGRDQARYRRSEQQGLFVEPWTVRNRR